MEPIKIPKNVPACSASFLDADFPTTPLGPKTMESPNGRSTEFVRSTCACFAAETEPTIAIPTIPIGYKIVAPNMQKAKMVETRRFCLLTEPARCAICVGCSVELCCRRVSTGGGTILSRGGGTTNTSEHFGHRTVFPRCRSSTFKELEQFGHFCCISHFHARTPGITQGEQ